MMKQADRERYTQAAKMCLKHAHGEIWEFKRLIRKQEDRQLVPGGGMCSTPLVATFSIFSISTDPLLSSEAVAGCRLLVLV